MGCGHTTIFWDENPYKKLIWGVFKHEQNIHTSGVGSNLSLFFREGGELTVCTASCAHCREKHCQVPHNPAVCSGEP